LHTDTKDNSKTEVCMAKKRKKMHVLKQKTKCKTDESTEHGCADNNETEPRLDRSVRIQTPCPEHTKYNRQKLTHNKTNRGVKIPSP